MENCVIIDHCAVSHICLRIEFQTVNYIWLNGVGDRVQDVRFVELEAQGFQGGFEGWEGDLVVSETGLRVRDEMLTIEEVAREFLEIYSDFSVFL